MVRLFWAAYQKVTLIVEEALNSSGFLEVSLLCASYIFQVAME